MATTYIQPGDVLVFTAPSGGVVSGEPVLIGKILAIPLVTAAEAATFQGAVKGVHLVAKADEQAWAEGVVVYWDDTAKVFTTDSAVGANKLVGIAAEAVADTAGLTTGKVRLNGIGVA